MPGCALMKWKLAALLTAMMFELHTPPPADACGVKLTIKNPKRKATARSSNPSDVLLLGKPPRRLQRDLAAAGHRVEVAPAASAAKRTTYAVVIADASQESDARSKFANSVVMVRSGNDATVVRNVEKQVARRPVAVAAAPTVVGTRERRVPVKIGPSREEREIVAAQDSKDAQRTTEQAPPRVAAAEPKREEAKPAPEPTPAAADTKIVESKAASVETTRPVDTEPVRKTAKATKAASNPGELFFGYSRWKPQSTAALERTARWLSENPGISVVIEGHADPAGDPDANMALSQKRAEWVRDYLVNAGIDASRLDVTAFGSSRLKYASTDGRNRRVSIVTK